MNKLFNTTFLLFTILLICNGCDALSGDDDEDNILTGTVSGLVIDASTSEPIANVIIRLSNIDDNFEDSVLTNQSGRFSIKNVPVNSAQIVISGDEDSESIEIGNFPYSLHIEMPDGTPYRPNYAFYPIFLTFSATNGDGNVDNLVSSALLSIPKRNVTVKGKLLDNSNREPISGITVHAYTSSFFVDLLDFGVEIDNEIFLGETSTASNGDFQFDALEQGSKIYFKYIDRTDSTKVIDGQSITYELPFTESGEAYTKNIGEIFTSDTDKSSAFYVSDISVEEGDDIEVSSGMNFIFSFSKPVKQTNYTDDSVPFDIGSGTMIDDIFLFETSTKAKDANGNYEIDVEWTSDFKKLTITPIDQMLEAYEYQLNTSDFLTIITDNEDNILTYNSSTFAQSREEAGIIDFTTAGDAQSPANPVLSVMPYDINWNGGNVTFMWDVETSGPEISYYEIYTKKDGINFTKSNTVDVSDAFNNEIEFTTSTGILNIKEQSTFDTSVSFDLKVKAVSNNLVKSNFSNTISVNDNIEPGLTNASYSNSDSTITATFSEPMDFGTLENISRYQIVDAFGDIYQDVSISDIQLVYSVNGITQVTLQLSRQNAPVANQRLTVASSITDLAGNSVDNDDTDGNNTFNEVNID